MKKKFAGYEPWSLLQVAPQCCALLAKLRKLRYLFSSQSKLRVVYSGHVLDVGVLRRTIDLFGRVLKIDSSTRGSHEGTGVRETFLRVTKQRKAHHVSIRQSQGPPLSWSLESTCRGSSNPRST